MDKSLTKSFLLSARCLENRSLGLNATKLKYNHVILRIIYQVTKCYSI